MRTAAVICGVLALVTGCGSTGDGAAPTSATSTTPSGVSAAEMSSIVAAAGIPPKPDEATAAAYVAELDAIDPDIVHRKPDKAISRGRDQCSSIPHNRDDQAKLIDLTNRRFTSPAHPEGHGLEIADRVLVVVRKHLCPTY